MLESARTALGGDKKEVGWEVPTPPVHKMDAPPLVNDPMNKTTTELDGKPMMKRERAVSFFSDGPMAGITKEDLHMNELKRPTRGRTSDRAASSAFSDTTGSPSRDRWEDMENYS